MTETAGALREPENVSRYSGVAITLHWLVALLILFNLVMIWFVDRYPDAWVRPVIDLHKSIGITVLGLVLLRILWRVGHRPPALPSAYPRVEKLAAHAAHALLYAVILLLPLTGWIHDSAWKAAPTHPMSLFGLVPWPRIAFIMHQPAAAKEALHSLFFAFHKYLAYLLYALFVLHVGAALKHQFLDKEPELERMLPPIPGAPKS
jgi:cytochrome b561